MYILCVIVKFHKIVFVSCENGSQTGILYILQRNEIETHNVLAVRQESATSFIQL